MRGWLDSIYHPGDSGTYEVEADPVTWEQLRSTFTAAYSAGALVPVVDSAISFMVKYENGDGVAVSSIGFKNGLVLNIIRRNP